MKPKKLLVAIGIPIAVIAIGFAVYASIVGIPPRDQSASVLLATQKTATNDQMVTSTNKMSTTGTTGTGPAIAFNDLCLNFDGNQQALPHGYVQDANQNCVCAPGTIGLIDPGAPAGVIPECVPKLNVVKRPVVDVCPNITGVQAKIPTGYTTVGGLCLPSLTATLSTDQCSNISGIQATVPAGYQVSGGVCTLVPVATTPGPGFYLMAGHDNTHIYNDVWKMNTTTNAWTNITTNAPWTKREYSESVYFNGKIYLMGGIDASGYKNDIWTYDGTTWNQVDTDPVAIGIQNAPWSPRARFGSAVFQNKIYIFGGRINSSGTTVKDVWSFNGTTWHQEQDAPWYNSTTGMNAFATLVYNSQLWVLGGAGNGINNETWSFDGVTWTHHWTYNTLVPRMLAGAAVYGGKMWIIAGYSGVSVLNDAQVSTDGIHWNTLNSAIWPDPNLGLTANNISHILGRRELTVATFNNKIWAMAGSYDLGVGSTCDIHATVAGAECFFNDVWTYDGVNWTQVDADPSTPTTVDNAPWAARDGLTSVYVP